MECVKAVAALTVLCYLKGGSLFDTAAALRSEVCSSYWELLKLAVPSFVYMVQNNILYLAIANLDAPTYQVVYNAKILTTVELPCWSVPSALAN